MPKSLMVVDDSTTMRKIITRIISMCGLDFSRMVEACSAVEALEKLETEPVDIILCDINMPGMSGVELVKKLREEIPSCADTKIIMVSAESCQNCIDDVIADGADGYITKPFTPEKFQEKLSLFM